MESPSKLPCVTRATGVHARIEALGLQTYNDPSSTVRNPAVFHFEPVIKLYKLEIPALFGRLMRDAHELDREDPNLFDGELEQVLLKFGPLIWPEPGKGSREHLRTAQAGTLYEADLAYSHDTAILKERLRGLILSKRVNQSTDIQALIEKRQNDARMKVLGTTSTPTKRAPSKSATRLLSSQKRVRRHSSFVSRDESGYDDTDNLEQGVSTRRRAFQKASSSKPGFNTVQIRMYQYRDSNTAPQDAEESVFPISMFLTQDGISARDYFDRVGEQIGADCGFMVFKFPEDMDAPAGGVRVDGEASEAETAFQRVLDILRKAKQFPGKPDYRVVEVAVGLETPRRSVTMWRSRVGL